MKYTRMSESAAWHHDGLSNASRIVLLLLLLFLVACGSKEQGFNAPSIKDQVQANNKRVSDNQGYEQIISLLDFVHTVVALRPTSPEFNLYTPEQNLFMAINNPETYGHACGGYAITSYDVLRDYGYRVKLIQGFYPNESGTGYIDGHVFLEVLIDDEWFMFDPTFNVAAVDDAGNHIDVETLKERTTNGDTLKWLELGTVKQSVDNYPTSYKDLLTIVRELPEGVRSTQDLDIKHEGEKVY